MIATRIGTGKVQHAAAYDPETGKLQLYCDSLTYTSYLAVIPDPTPPNAVNVTCKKCTANSDAWKSPQ